VVKAGQVISAAMYSGTLHMYRYDTALLLNKTMSASACSTRALQEVAFPVCPVYTFVASIQKKNFSILDQHCYKMPDDSLLDCHAPMSSEKCPCALHVSDLVTLLFARRLTEYAPEGLHSEYTQ
jgi:hypothetical protein